MEHTLRNMKRLYTKILSLPLGTAGVERVFSQLKLIKTTHRNIL